jgi:hypothetical protein
VNNKEENSLTFCLDFVQEFCLCTDITNNRALGGGGGTAMFDKSGPFREKLKARRPTQIGVSSSLAGRERIGW